MISVLSLQSEVNIGILVSWHSRSSPNQFGIARSRSHIPINPTPITHPSLAFPAANCPPSLSSSPSHPPHQLTKHTPPLTLNLLSHIFAMPSLHLPLLLTTLLALLLTNAVTGHNIQMGAHTKECFHEVLHKDDRMTVTFQVGDREFGGAGNLEIDFWVSMMRWGKGMGGRRDGDRDRDSERMAMHVHGQCLPLFPALPTLAPIS